MAAALTLPLALTVVLAYSLDRLGISFPPAPMLATMLMAIAAAGLWLFDRSAGDRAALAAFSMLVVGICAWLLWLARPDWLPVGSGPDLTHHLILIRYIEHGWRLVHDPAAEPYLGEMMFYTPGSHILVALLGAWTRSSGLHAFQPLIAWTVALKAGFVFVIARRLLPGDVPAVPIAVIGTLSLFASQTFFLGSFIQYAFLAQIVAELFAIAMWWALTVWHQQGGWMPMVCFGLFGAALAFLYP